VVDVFTVPDYKTYYKDEIDKKLKYYGTLLDTKLQWKFEKCSESNFPLNVKVSYRAFASDNSVMIIPMAHIPRHYRTNIGVNTGYQAIHIINDWEPTNKITQKLVGDFHLAQLPRKPLEPEAFKSGTRAKLETSLSCIYNYFKDTPTTTEWKTFDTTYLPQNDSVENYWREHNVQIPLCELFQTATPLVSSVFAAPESRVVNTLPLVRSTASVQTTRNSRQPPFVWLDTGLPVFPEINNTVVHTQEEDDDLLARKDFNILTNKTLIELIGKLNAKYGLKLSKAGKKDVLIQKVEKAIEEQVRLAEERRMSEEDRILAFANTTTGSAAGRRTAITSTTTTSSSPVVSDCSETEDHEVDDEERDEQD